MTKPAALTNAAITAIYEEELARPDADAASAYRGTVTRVHELLAEGFPPPAAEDVAHMPAPGVMVASMSGHARPKSSAAGSSITRATVDEHHHAHQVAHHNDLWAVARARAVAAGLNDDGGRK